MRSLHVIILTHLVVRSSALCYPGEPLTDCARRQQQEERSKQPVITKSVEKDDDGINQVNPCLGVSNKEGFIGECKKSSNCAEVSSESLNCLFSTVCCKKVVTVRSPSIPGSRPSDINEVFSRQFEDMNRENCGLRGNINLEKNSFLSEKSFFSSTELCSWRG